MKQCIVLLTMLRIKKLMGMHNKGTYTRVYTRVCARIDIRIYAKIRWYNTRMRSSDISELHCTCTYHVLACPKLSQMFSAEDHSCLAAPEYVK